MTDKLDRRLKPSSRSTRFESEGAIRTICSKDVKFKVPMPVEWKSELTSGQVIRVLFSFKIDSRSNPGCDLGDSIKSKRFELACGKDQLGLG